ncbi:MAG: ATP-binding protein [Selenomonadaceae bacterium]|nr:ATP-binding protein [Selenomonadaceae bacterium]
MITNWWYDLNILCLLIAAVVFIDLYRREDSGFKSTMLILMIFSAIAIWATNSSYTALTLHEMHALGKLSASAKDLYALFGVLFICRFLAYKLPRWLMLFMVGGSFIGTILILSSNYHSLVYTGYRLADSVLIPGAKVVLTGKGIGYLLIAATLITELCTALYVLYISYRENLACSNPSRATLCKHILLAQFTVIIPVIITNSRLITDDLVPVGIFTNCLIQYLFFAHYGLYDIVRAAKDSVIENTAEGVIVLDKDMRVSYSNKAADILLPHMKPEQLASWILAEGAIDDTGGSTNLNIAGRTYSARLQNLSHEQVDKGYFITLVDITDMVTKAEQMRQLKERAEQANRAKSIFLANMSHEIRTPMNAIVGITEILLRDKPLSRQLEYLGNIRTAGTSLLAIINEILDFSKVESGKMELVNDRYEPLSLLNDMSMILLSRIGEKPVELQYSLAKDLPQVLIGDRVRLRQVLINLANNAIKFTAKGYVRISVRVEPNGENGILLHAAVSDTGQGISKENLKKLFSDFQQVDNLKNRDKEGTGLGLALSKRLVELMGGTIGVRSEEGLGSEFYFTVPQGVADDTPAASLNECVKEKSPSIGAIFSSTDNTNLLRELASDFGIRFVDIRQLSIHGRFPDFLFVDSAIYQSKSKLCNELKAHTQLVIVQNALISSIQDPAAIVINQPLYSMNFCQVLNRETVETAEVMRDESFTFIAPDVRVLIVDDNDMNLRVASGLLKPLGMQITTANSGPEAIRLVETSEPFDIIFMDHMMPGMDGCETTSIIRSHDEPYFKTVPIIALTANVFAESRALFMAAGMVGFVAKPIDSKEITAVLRNWLPPEKLLRPTKEDVQSIGSEEPDCGYEETADQPPASNELAGLPKIEGIDNAIGIKNCGTAKNFLGLLEDFVKMAELKCEEIEGYLQSGDIPRYTIEVHAMKSVARLIGAMDLGEKFFEMEMAGKNFQTDLIQEKTPPLLAEFYSYKERIAATLKKDDEIPKENLDNETIRELLITLRNAVSALDMDAMDDAMAQIAGARLPDDWAKDIARLEGYVTDMDANGTANIVNSLLEKLQ